MATKQNRLVRDFQRNRAVYLMALPVFLFYFIFKYLPYSGLIISFQNYNLYRGVTGSPWVGMGNFVRFLTGPYIGRLIKNTLLINIYSILWGFPAPIIFALMLNELRAGFARKAIQTISYMPHFISLVVVCGMVSDFCRDHGLFNNIAEFFGIPSVSILSQPELFRTVYVTSGIWQTLGWGSIIYLATLSTVDPNLYDAAQIDGAGRIKRILHISLPALVPVIIVQFIMRVGSILTVGFEKILLLYNPLTYETADVISTYVYRFGLQQGNYSFGTAVGLFNSVVNVIVLVTVNGLFRRFSEESLW